MRFHPEPQAWAEGSSEGTALWFQTVLSEIVASSHTHPSLRSVPGPSSPFPGEGPTPGYSSQPIQLPGLDDFSTSDR